MSLPGLAGPRYYGTFRGGGGWKATQGRTRAGVLSRKRNFDTAYRRTWGPFPLVCPHLGVAVLCGQDSKDSAGLRWGLGGDTGAAEALRHPCPSV